MRRTEARGASANSMRSVRASERFLAVRALASMAFESAPVPKNDNVVIGHTTILLDLQHSLPSGGFSRVKRAVEFRTSKSKAEWSKKAEDRRHK